jgi:hypothetical protein
MENINDIKVTPQSADDQLRIAIYGVMQCMVRGAIGCSPQVKPEAVMILCCHNLGRLMAEMYVGDELAVHKFRKACRDVFDRTTKEMPIIGRPDVNPEASTAVGAGLG